MPLSAMFGGSDRYHQLSLQPGMLLLVVSLTWGPLGTLPACLSVCALLSLCLHGMHLIGGKLSRVILAVSKDPQMMCCHYH